MAQQINRLHPAVARSLAVWHEMIRTRDMGALGTILHPDAVFRSPHGINPYQSADAITLALSTVIKVFDNFAYHREFATDDGLNVVIEFSASVQDKLLKG